MTDTCWQTCIALLFGHTEVRLKQNVEKVLLESYFYNTRAVKIAPRKTGS